MSFCTSRLIRVYLLFLRLEIALVVGLDCFLLREEEVDFCRQQQLRDGLSVGLGTEVALLVHVVFDRVEDHLLQAAVVRQ